VADDEQPVLKATPPSSEGEAQQRVPASTGPAATRKATISPASLRRGRHKHASSARTRMFGAWYSWAYAYQRPPGRTVSMYEEQTNQQPNVWTAGSHSLGQLWAIDMKGKSTVEEGWTEAPGQYPDVEPHLFVARKDAGEYTNTGYAGAGGVSWIQVSESEYPNMVVTHDDRVHSYAVEERGGNWWVWYDGAWIGYLPHSAWVKHFPSVSEIRAGGEVETPEESTCTDMGNGLYGTQANSATVVFTWWENASVAEDASFEGFATADPVYNIGQWLPSHTEPYGFHYGGPGWC
jgi:hypothetical protein